MAKKPIENINIKLNEQRAINAAISTEALQLEALANKWKELNRLAKQNKDIINKETELNKQKLASYKEEYGSLSNINKIIKETRIEQKELIKDINKTQQALNEQIDVEEKIKESKKEQAKKAKEAAAIRIKEIKDTSELDDLQRSITGEYGKQYGDQGAMLKKIEATKAIVHGIGEYLQKNTKLDERQREAIEAAADSYKSFPIFVAQLNSQKNRGLITDKQMATQIEEQLSSYDDIIAKIDTKDASLQKVLETLKLIAAEEREFSEAQMVHREKKQAGSQLLGAVVGGAPAGIGDVIEGGTGAIGTAASFGTAGMKAIPYIAIATTLAGIGKIITANNKQEVTAVELLYERIQKLREFEIKRREYQIQIDNNFPKIFADFDFDTQLAQAKLQFDEISKTAFFGQGLGSVSYANDKLQQMGISAKEIVATMSALSSVGMGANSAVQQLGENATVFQQATGTSAEEFGGLINMARQLNKVNGLTAAEFGNKLANTATTSGILYSDLKNQLVGASKEFLFYNDKNLDLLLEQATAVTKMGLDFNKLRDVGKGMVLNYNESIKKAMELSSLIQENVDITPALSMFYSGDNEGAAKYLQQSGILEKAQAKGMIAMNSLSQLFGGSLDILKTVPYETEGNPNAKTFKTIQERNNAYLTTGVEAQRTFAIDNAILTIKRAQLRLTKEEAEQQLTIGDKARGILISNMAEMEFQKSLDSWLATGKSLLAGNINMPFGNPNLVGQMTQKGYAPGVKSIVGQGGYSVDKLKTPIDLYGDNKTGKADPQTGMPFDPATYIQSLDSAQKDSVQKANPMLNMDFWDTQVKINQSLDSLNALLKSPPTPIIYLDSTKVNEVLKKGQDSIKGQRAGEPKTLF